jgi:hypothetical protein
MCQFNIYKSQLQSFSTMKQITIEGNNTGMWEKYIHVRYSTAW